MTNEQLEQKFGELLDWSAGLQHQFAEMEREQKALNESFERRLQYLEARGRARNGDR
jgi:hypothetical protein